MTRFTHLGVLGAGAWGTALAVTLGHSRPIPLVSAAHEGGTTGSAPEAGGTSRVTIWANEPEVAESLASGRGNPIFLPGIDLPTMNATTDLAALGECDAILAVVPAQFARATFTRLAAHVRAGTPILLCAKGIEQSTLSLMTDVLRETIPQAIPAVLSGPSFAADVARHLPTAVTLACADEALGRDLMQAIGRPTFRPYWSSDLIGAEIGGAVKNVLAIACGIVEGLELGKSAHAALIARGFAEMTRLGVGMGARAETLAGLCGLGDLVLTCSSPQSRNMSFGMALGRGEQPADILAARKAVTEGVATAPAMVALAAREGVDMPICVAVNDILTGRVSVRDAINKLLSRPFRGE